MLGAICVHDHPGEYVWVSEEKGVMRRMVSGEGGWERCVGEWRGREDG